MKFPRPIPAPKPGEPEADIEQYVSDKALEWFGLPNVKLNLQGRRGWPDRIYWLPEGRPLLIEYKRPGKEARALQGEVHAMLVKLGYDVHVCDNREDALQHIVNALGATALGRKLLARSQRR